MTDTHLFTELAEGAGALLVVIAAYFGVRAARSPRRRYEKQWAALAPQIDGKTQGAALVGTYNGAAIHVRLAPETGTATPPAVFYELTLHTGMHGGNWQLLVTGQKFLGGGAQEWRVRSKDEGLARRLTEGGVVEHAQGLPEGAEVSFTAKSGALLLRQKADGPDAVPAPDVFRPQLERMDTLAQINRAVNRDV